jgi:hypothetical protein
VRASLSRLWILGIVVAGLAAVVPARRAYYQYRSRDGVAVLSSNDSAVNAAGHARPLLAGDSAVFVFIVGNDCSVCAERASTSAAFTKWAATQRVAMRWFVLAGADPKQFADKVGSGDGVFGVASSWPERFGIRATPSVLLLDREGRLRGKWIGWIPKQDDAISALQVLSD